MNPTTFLVAMHCGGIISLCVTATTVFIVIRSATKQTKNFSYLVVYHLIWSLFLDLHHSAFVIPDYFFPIVGGISRGFFSPIGIDAAYHSQLGFFWAGGALSSIATMFHYRFQHLLPDGEPWKLPNNYYQLLCALIIHIILISSFFPLNMYLPDESEIPGIARYYYSITKNTDFLENNTSFIYPDTAVQSLAVIMFGGTLFCIIASFYIFKSMQFLNSSNNLSKETKKLQRKLIFRLILQVTLPFSIIMCPMIFAYLFSYYVGHTPAVIRSCVLVVAHHGLFGCILLVVVTDSYRTKIFGHPRIPKVIIFTAERTDRNKSFN